MRLMHTPADLSPFPDGAGEHLRVQVGVVARPVAGEVSEPVHA